MKIISNYIQKITEFYQLCIIVLTNINIHQLILNMEIFKKHLEIIKNSKYNFLNPNEFDSKFKTSKSEKEVLITIDDAFESFYNEAWPYLRDNKIPFILFVSTEPVGNNGYMTWDQIREIDAVDFSLIGHHSHSHEYLIEETERKFHFRY